MSMKILYAVQATGNGHISRAMELMPYLQQYGNVDVFLSGSNSHLNPNLPVAYKSKGLSLFYGNTGGLDYWRMFKECSIKRVWKEAHALPVEKYDLVINDFENICSLACKFKGVKSIGFGHQASFQSKYTPRPDKKDFAGELILQHYAGASDYVGLHFESYDDFIFSPIIKEEIIHSTPNDLGHITVYLSHYSDDKVMEQLKQLPGLRFEIFSKKVKVPIEIGNIILKPISNEGFTESLINCHGVITGAGFETPAEALYLGKKVLALPIKGQYEQLCNASAMKAFGVTVIDSIKEEFVQQVGNWVNNSNTKQLTLNKSTYEIVQQVIERGRALSKTTDKNFKQLLTEEDLMAMY